MLCKKLSAFVSQQELQIILGCAIQPRIGRSLNEQAFGGAALPGCSRVSHGEPRRQLARCSDLSAAPSRSLCSNEQCSFDDHIAALRCSQARSGTNETRPCCLAKRSTAVLARGDNLCLIVQSVR